MPNWLIKTAIQRGISWLPHRQFWNGLFQSCFTRSTELTSQKFETKVSECQRHLNALLSVNPGAADFTVCELGTGWFPIIPLGLYLCGAREIWTIDIDPLVRAKGLKKVLDFCCDYADRGELKRLLPAFRPERMDLIRSLAAKALVEDPVALLARIHIHLLVRDAQETPMPNGSIDFFVSSGVLEYIPRPVLAGIMAESRRLAAPGAVMSHRLNLVDQFSYFDSAITAFNFLQYTEKQWRWLNSPLTWQNRLRLPDFRQLITEAGFELVRQENTPGSAEDLARVKLAPEFAHYTREDLLVLHSFLTARLPAKR